MKTLDDAPAILDTNLLVYAGDVRSPQHAAAKAVRDAAAVGQFQGYVTVQILLEFVSVVTSAKRVHSPLSVSDAWKEVDRIASAFTVLAYDLSVVKEAGRIAQATGLKGADIFDATIAATALRHGIRVIYTFDAGVFGRVPGIEVREPS